MNTMQKVQTGLRIPENLYDELRRTAEETGVSVNAQALYLIDIGLKAVRLGIQEQGRVLSRNQKDTGE